MNEEWRTIPGFEGYYEVSSAARVRSVPRIVPALRGSYLGTNYRRQGKIISQRQSLRGHMMVGLSVNGVRVTRGVHRLMLMAFVGGGDGLHACHINGIPDDNRLENLRWGTNSDNQLDSVHHGTHWKARNTHCPQGHEYDIENTFYSVRGHRRCRECVRRSTRESMRRSYAKRKAASC